jgi:hypothetical protein
MNRSESLVYAVGGGSAIYSTQNPKSESQLQKFRTVVGSRAPSPSPRPSPTGRGRHAGSRSNHRSASHPTQRRLQLSLSRWERVGVRGNGPSELFKPRFVQLPPESRNPKQIRIPKARMLASSAVHFGAERFGFIPLQHSDLPRISDFELRISGSSRVNTELRRNGPGKTYQLPCPGPPQPRRASRLLAATAPADTKKGGGNHKKRILPPGGRCYRPIRLPDFQRQRNPNESRRSETGRIG